MLTKDITKDGVFFKTGTVLNDSIINLLPTTQAKEAAHALNRRTEFSILRNDFIPKQNILKPVSPKIEVVENPEENSVPYTITADGNYEGICFVNGISEYFDYSKGEKEFYIQPATALKLLKDGVIDKTDFKGDVTKIIGEGSIADKAVITLKEVRIGKNVVKDLEITVNKKIKSSILLGDAILSKFGSFTIDANESKIIFK